MPSDRIMAVEYEGPEVVIYNTNRPEGVADAKALNYVYKGDYDSGYGLFLNYFPNAGAPFASGTMHADEVILGNGFQLDKDYITGFEVKVYRSVIDPTDGKTLATVYVELWDGDPFGAVETPNKGVIASASFAGIPGPAVVTLHADIPKTQVNDHMIWIVVYADEACRMGWRISSKLPEMGSILMGGSDLAMAQTDYDAGFLGSLDLDGIPGGHCCNDMTRPCLWDPADPLHDPCEYQPWQCPYAGLPGPPCYDDGRGFCTDMFAESAWIYYYGGPCAGGIDDFCANHVANIFGQSNFTVTLQPRKDDSGGIYEGNEVRFAKGGAKVWLDVIFWNWGSEGATVKTWQMKINSDGYYSALHGTLTPWNPPCTSNADCQVAHQHNLFTNQCNDPAYPPGGCNPAFQDFSVDPGCQPAPLPGQPCLGLQIPACSISTKDFICGSTINDWPEAPDDGNPHYGATVVLDVSPGATGTFTVPFDIGNTWMKTGNTPIRMISHVPALITIQTGQCCDMSIPPGYPFSCISDEMTENQCIQYGVDNGIPVKFDPNATCDDPCGCTDDFQCDDGDACTVDECINNACDSTVPVDCDDGLYCTVDDCDPDADVTWPEDGCFHTPLAVDDGLFCTEDWCDEVNDVISNKKIDCSDTEFCTLDRCVELVDGYECQNIDLNVVPHEFTCPSGDPDIDCLDTIDQYSGEQIGLACQDGYCICATCFNHVPCSDQQACRADLYFEITPSDKPEPMCFAKGEKIEVDVFKAPGGFPVPIAIPITAVQFTATYDPTCMDFLSASPGLDFSFPIYQHVDEVAGEIFMAVGVDPFSGGGVPGVGHVADFSFEKMSGCSNCFLDFGGENPYNTFMSDDEGWAVCADTMMSPEIHENDKLTISVPGDMKVNVDCDAVTAMVSWDAPWGDSSCFDPDCDPQQEKCYTTNLDCWGYGPDGQDFTYLAETGGELPIGVSTFGCTVTSKICGDSLDAGWTVTVNEATALDVEVQVEPIILAEDLLRCINFELYADCVQDPVLVQGELMFGSKWDHIGHYTGEIKIPDTGQWVCITAQDQVHSLRAVADLVCGADGVYHASFKGDPDFFGGNWLTQGNLDAWKKVGDGVNVIDITDFGTFVQLYLTTPNPNTYCEFKHDGPHGDINGDGIVNALDFAFIMRNFMEHSKGACCPDGIGGIVGRTEISVRELRQMGLRDLVVADLNGDGLVNTDDMTAFMEGARPDPQKVPGHNSSNLRGR
jgi:hypothetical protein